jgi:hypothetical protein
MKNTYLALVVLIGLTLCSCKKDSKSSSNTLVSKTWKRALVDKNPATNPASPSGTINSSIVYYAVEDCEKDDTFKFDTDGNLTFKRNAEKCDPMEQSEEVQSYTIDRVKKELTINGVKYNLAEESKDQIKYYALLPSNNDPRFLVFLLQ